MKKRAWTAVGCLSLLGLSLTFGPAALAVEPARDFLEKLRERRYYEEAIDYLDSLQSMAGVPIEMKETLLYERGLTLVEASKFKRDSALREKDLNAAQESLKKFLAEHQDHLLAMAAESQVANVSVERGRMLVDRAKKQPDKKDDLLGQARKQFEQAISVFKSLREDLRKKLEALPVIPESLDAKTEKNKQLVKARDQRDRWRADYLQALLLSAAASEESAEAYAPGSKEHTAALEGAAKEYAVINEKYRTKIVGLYARQYQARCLLRIQGDAETKKKNTTAALTYLGEVLSEPEAAPEVRNLKKTTYLLATQAWLDAGNYAEAFLKGGGFIDEARPNEQRDPDMQQIRVNVAEAILKYVAELKKKDPSSKDIRPAMTKGREYAKDAFKYADGAVKRKAGELMPQFGGAESVAAAGTTDKEPKNFEEAKDLGKEAIDSISSAQMVMKLVPPRIKQETDQKIREELEAQVNEAKDTLANAKGRALNYFRKALQKAGPDTTADDLNTVRYFLCYLEYEAGNYFNALTYGQFLAYRYPSSPGAKQGALIAMASCQKLYAEDKEANHDFESQNILKIAQYIVDKWPDQKEAEEALNTLIPFLIKAGRLDDAEKYVQQIPETSSYRGMAELKTGQALWANYLVGMKEIRELEGDLAKWEQDGFPEGRTAASVQADLAKLKAPLDTLKKRAQQTLVDGVKRMQAAGDVNPIIASAVLSLAQIYVDTNQAGQAVALLEDPKIGALTLVNKKDESVAREGFAEEVYKTALRAYISSLAGSKNADETVGKAKQIMAALKERLGTTPEGAQKLVMNYVSVAKDLKTQLDIAPDDATRGNLAKGFEAFLKQVGDQANEFNVLNWVAETFKSMGDAFGRDKANRPKREALDYYNQAIAMYDKILKAADKDKNFLPNPKVLPAVQQSLAMSYRDVGKFKDAADQFRAILAANPGLIGVQMEAAYNYQAWAGYDSKSTKYYKSAILGWQDPKTGKAVIWGWKPMSDKIAGDQRFQDQYYEARYNLAVCRFKYGQSLEKNDPEREKVLNAAKLDVVLLAQLYPELGGDKWRSKFDTLLRQIQRESGDKAPKGLAAVPKESSTSTKPMGTN